MSVYFIRAGAEGPVKIGTASNVEARMAELQCGHYLELQIIRAVVGSRPQETCFHRHFSFNRIRGEWFKFCEEMLTLECPAVVETSGSPDSFRGIIELWPTVVAFAADLRVKEVTARAWKARGFIPAEYWEEVCAAAKARGFDGVTPDALTAIVSRQREHLTTGGDAA